MLKTGQPFADFSLQGQDEKTHTLKEYAGQWLVVYFYPKDNTSGCTLEAQNFAALFNSFAKNMASIIGVSPDSVKSHCNFAARHGLPFTILSDPEHSLLEAAGVWQLKKMAGREYMGVVRSTYLVDPEGKVAYAWPKVKVKDHAQQVFTKLKELA